MSSTAPLPSPSMSRSPEALSHEQLWAKCLDLAAELPDLRITAVEHYFDDSGKRQPWFTPTVTWSGTPETVRAVGSNVISHSITTSPMLRIDQANAEGISSLEQKFISSMGETHYTRNKFVETTTDRDPEHADPGLRHQLTQLCIREMGSLRYAEIYHPIKPDEQQTDPKLRFVLAHREPQQLLENDIGGVATVNFLLSLIVDRDIEYHAANWRLAKLPVDRSQPPRELSWIGGPSSTGPTTALHCTQHFMILE